MIVKPKIRNFICTTAHPDGCEEQVRRQIQYIKNYTKAASQKRVLVIGSSTGYGLASRICAAWYDMSPTIGVCLEREATERRTATAGWYNTAAFEKFAKEDGLYAKTIIGDAFSKKTKDETLSLIKRDWGQVDIVIYSLAAPRRTMPDGTTYYSVLKTVDKPFESKNLDLSKNSLINTTIPVATEEELRATVHVMGGEDWEEWILELKEAGLLAPDARTIAYSYIGPELTYPIYKDGTIGHAKEHLYRTAVNLNRMGVSSFVSVNKALVTQASSAIPVVPLYLSILYKIMKDEGVQEGTIEQIYRLWSEFLMKENPITDIPYRIRLDNCEMNSMIQSCVSEVWNKVTGENLEQFADIKGFWKDFYHLFGFGYDNVDYETDTEIDRHILSKCIKE